MALCLALSVACGPAAAGTLDELLEEIRSDRARQTTENEAREARFRENRERQRALLAEERARLDRVERESDRLRAEFDANQSRLAAQQAVLQERTHDLGELHGVVRQIAGDVAAVVGESLQSAGRPERTQIAEQLAASPTLPTSAELEDLWALMLDEMVASHRVDQSDIVVIGADGIETERRVTRIGPFTAWGGGDFLRFLPESGRLMAPARQPPAHLRAAMAGFAGSPAADAVAVVDPTRGALIALLGQRADLRERIRQGGVIGYVIIGVGIVGLLNATRRIVELARLRRQIPGTNAAADGSGADSPVGRLIAVAAEHADADAETLGLRLDEAILTETPRLRRGISFVAMLAGIAPLLGLLGTVTGIIETFQAITLYGTGDPRLMSGGISQALVTTVMGLLVAIPMFLLHNLLNERSNDLVTLLDERAAGLVAERAGLVADRAGLVADRAGLVAERAAREPSGG